MLTKEPVMRSNSKTSRRSVLVAVAGGAAVAGGLASPARGQTKLTHAVAKYQDHPNGQQRCAICLQFQPPGSCHIVQSPIVATGWCQFFAARENAR